MSAAQAALAKALAASASGGSEPGGGSASGGSGSSSPGGSGRPSSGGSGSGGSTSGPSAASPSGGTASGGPSAGSSRSGGTGSGASTAGGGLPSGGSTAGGSRSGGAGSGSASAGSSGGGRTITPEQITADEAAVGAAAAELKVAQQNLDQATLRSPIAGTVAAVNLRTGDRLGASSTTATIEIVGTRAHQVTAGVDVTKIGSVEVGQTASVQPDGCTAALAAKVIAVGVAPTSSGGSTYPVTLAFTGTPPDLRTGISAAVTITTARAASALAVPTSAVTRTPAGAFVTVLADGRTTRTRVGIGAVGPDYTQLTSGIEAGAVVVLADLSEAVPASSTTTRFGGAGGAGTRFGGAGGTPPR